LKLSRIPFWLLMILALAANGAGQSKGKLTSRKSAIRASNIRQIDFKNFDYGRLCAVRDDSWVPIPRVKLILRRGHQQYGDEKSEHVDLSSVKYVDFDGDGKEEAFVVIDGSTATAAGDTFLAAYVFAYRNGLARQIWSRCNENSRAVLKGRSILFTYPEYVGADAHCCPSYQTTKTYGWKSSRIALISKRRKKNE
jgi:hypothetical protein